MPMSGCKNTASLYLYDKLQDNAKILGCLSWVEYCFMTFFDRLLCFQNTNPNLSPSLLTHLFSLRTSTELLGFPTALVGR